MVTRSMRLRFVLVAALIVPELARSDEQFAPISEVVAAFKRELRDAQIKGVDAGCRLSIEKVSFEFEAFADESASGGVGGKASLFGLALGGAAEASETTGQRSVIAISLKPDPEAEGRHDVTDDLAGLSAILVNLKEQIAESSASDPPFALEAATVTLRFSVERKANGKLEIAIAKGGTEARWGRSHLMKLSLRSAEEDGC
jgi:hypothetical protein